MATDFYIKEGDTAPPIVAILKGAEGSAVDLTGSTVRFIMSLKGATSVTVDQPADVLDSAAGQVGYNWQTGDTDVVGTYQGEFEVAWIDGTYETFPNSVYINIKIVKDLGGTVGSPDN